MNITLTGYYDQLLEVYQCTNSLAFVGVAVLVVCSEVLPLAQTLIGKHDEDVDVTATEDDDDDHCLFRNINTEDVDLWKDLANRLSNSNGVLHAATQVLRSRAFASTLFDVNPTLISLRGWLLGFRVHKHVKRRRRGRKSETSTFEERASSYTSSTTSSTDQFDSAASSDSPSSSGSD